MRKILSINALRYLCYIVDSVRKRSKISEVMIHHPLGSLTLIDDTQSCPSNMSQDTMTPDNIRLKLLYFFAKFICEKNIIHR